MADPLAPVIVVAIGVASIAYLVASGSRSRSRAAGGLLFAYGVGATFAGVLLMFTFHLHPTAVPAQGTNDLFGGAMVHIHGLHEALADASTADMALFVTGASAFVFGLSFALNQLCFRQLAARVQRRADSAETARLVALCPGGERLVVTQEAEPSAFCFAVLGRGTGRFLPAGREYLVLTTALTRAMDDEMLKGVVAHERAHVLSGDSRYLPVVRAARRLVFFDPFYRWIERRFEVEREFAADRAAVARTGDPAALARALLKALDLRASPRGRGCGLVGACSPGVVVRRIELLLEMAERSRENGAAVPG